MSFVDVSFPDTLALGSHGGPCFSTSVVATLGGDEQRNRAWKYARRKYEVGQVHRSETETRALLAFFRSIAVGHLNSFRLKDPLPGESSCANEPLGVGDDVTRAFALIKTYTSGSQTHVRPITRPGEDTLRVSLDGTRLTADTDYLLDTDVGVVTLVAIPTTGQVLTASFDFDVEVRFDTDQLPLRWVAPNVYSWDSITLWEERPAQPTGAGESLVSLVTAMTWRARWEITIPGVTA